MIKKITPRTLVIYLLVVVAVLFTRFYNLDHTARFTQDESTDLVRMKQYWEERKITLVGPISTDNTKVFSSLTYYMVMPFAAAANFDPIGPVYGTAFWGVLTAVLLILIVHKQYPNYVLPATLLAITWYPLVEMSRWAWNPHFVVFWSALGVLAYLYRAKLFGWGEFLSALCFGMLIHHHYIAVLATAPFIGLLILKHLREKKVRTAALVLVGYVLPILPFIVFDLRHPPGLFITKYLLGETPHVETSLSIGLLFSHFWRNYTVFIESIAVGWVFQLLIGVLFPALVWFDLRSKSFKRMLWISPVLVTLLGAVILNEFQARYIYPAVLFLFIWLLLERKDVLGRFISKSIFGLLLFASLLSIIPQLVVTKVPPDIYSLTAVSKLIAHTIQENTLSNSNVAALAGPDPAPLAEKYRDLIRMYGGDLREASEYSVSENLFVATTNTAEAVALDKSFAMQAFETAELKESFEIPNSEWKVYWYAY
jgi:hypothetical protein